MNSPSLTRADVAAVVSYDPETGMFCRVDDGSPVTMDKSTGYHRVKIGKSRYYCHRLAWLMVHGEWPTCMVDHINRDQFDNRICNLRQASAVENQYNRPAQKNNTSGIKGVVWRKARGVWQVTFRVNKKTTHFGSYKTLEEAKAAAERARIVHHGEFAVI